MGELANCPRCDVLFVKDTRSICHNCYKEEEKAFDMVYKYLREQNNRTATIPQIVEATGVEQKLIEKFVKERRLRPSHFPNLWYSCARCSNKISEGKLCDDCKDNLRSDIENQETIENLANKNKVRERAKTYFSSGDEKK
jgi:flagellar operon protein (TIGR03826 family)